MTMSILHHKPNQKKVGFKLSLLLLPVLFSFLFSCRYQVPESSLKAVSQKTKDSVDYLPEHYYTLNSNFEVTSDSLLLQQLPLIDVLPVWFIKERSWWWRSLWFRLPIRWTRFG